MWQSRSVFPCWKSQLRRYKEQGQQARQIHTYVLPLLDFSFPPLPATSLSLSFPVTLLQFLYPHLPPLHLSLPLSLLSSLMNIEDEWVYNIWKKKKKQHLKSVFSLPSGPLLTPLVPANLWFFFPPLNQTLLIATLCPEMQLHGRHSTYGPGWESRFPNVSLWPEIKGRQQRAKPWCASPVLCSPLPAALSLAPAKNSKLWRKSV